MFSHFVKVPSEVGAAGRVALATIDKTWEGLKLLLPEEGQPTSYFTEEAPIIVVHDESV